MSDHTPDQQTLVQQQGTATGMTPCTGSDRPGDASARAERVRGARSGNGRTPGTTADTSDGVTSSALMGSAVAGACESEGTLRAPAAPWTGAGRLCLNLLHSTLTNPFIIGFALVLPIVMYFIFGNGKPYSLIELPHGNYAADTLVLMTAYGVTFTTSSLGANIALERAGGVSRLFALTPLPPLVHLLCRLVTGSVVALLIVLVTFGIGAFTDARMTAGAWVASALVILAVSVLPAALGVACGYLVRHDGTFALVSGILVVSSFASGMFIPLEEMGSTLQTVAPWTPLYGLVQVVQCPLLGTDVLTWKVGVNLVAWFAVFVGLGVVAQRRDTGRE